MADQKQPPPSQKKSDKEGEKERREGSQMHVVQTTAESAF